MSPLFDICYDILTIILSIADITTDIIILLSFYYQSRTTFFIISLVILVVAHVCYSIAFQIRFEVPWKWGFGWGILTFFILLPVASIFSFLFLFTEDPKSAFSIQFQKMTKLNVEDGFENSFFADKNRSKMSKWIVQKVSKHLGFIMEAAFESLPQSLLQCIAIVYYKEANYVSIISIFLSMFSVMTKSIVLSQAIDIKTYIWSWLCIVIDFFGIFFTLTWVFYTNDTLLQPIFLGYFSIIGQIWFYKVTITILPVIAGGLFLWFCYFMLKIVIQDINSVCWGIFFVIMTSICVLLLVPFACIAFEIFCFSFIAFAVYKFCTNRWNKFNDKIVNESINEMIYFVSKASMFDSGDRMLRILAVNYSLFTPIKYHKKYKCINELIDETEDEHGLEGLRKITFGNVRRNCGTKKRYRTANILPEIIYQIKSDAPDGNDYLDCLCCRGRSSGFANVLDDCCDYVCIFWTFMLIFPVFLIGKMFQIIFPYIIVGYLCYYNQWSEIHLFQLVMLLAYIGLQIIWFVFGIIVFRINYWLWHLETGESRVYIPQPIESVVEDAKDWYIQRASLPWIERFISEMYGKDIGDIIMEYFQSIKLNSS